MKYNLQNIEQLRRSFAATFIRAGEIISADIATLTKFPNSCDAQTALFAKGLCVQAQELVLNACKPLNILKPDLLQPLSDLHGLHLDRQYESEASANGTSAETVAAASLALANRLAGTAAQMLRLAEDCLEGERTVTGEQIKHGPLWYK